MRLKKILWFSLVALAIAASVGATFLIITKESPVALANFTAAWTEKEPEETISMIFTGDIMLGRYIAVLREQNGGDFPFTHMPEILDTAKTSLQVDEIDLVVGNIEGPISSSNYVNPGTAMRFNFKPEVAELLDKVGFTTLSMANNHTLDQGSDAYQETYNLLTAQGIHAYGHADIADGPYTFTKHEFATKTIGFLGFNDAVFPLDEATALAKIAETAPKVDFLIVSVHWGVEYEKTARASITELAHQFVDAGANFIHGHHPHVIQNAELYKGAPIYYSLGNFTFDQYWSPATQEGLVVGLKLEGDEISTTELIVDLVNKGEPKPRIVAPVLPN